VQRPRGCPPICHGHRATEGSARSTIVSHDNNRWSLSEPCRHAQAHAHDLADYSSQHSRMRSNRKGGSASLRWQCAITYATPWTSSTRRGVITRDVGRCHSRSYTIVTAHRSESAVVSASKPGGDSIARSEALAKVSGREKWVRSVIVLTVGKCCSTARNISLPDHASDGARCSAPWATLTMAQRPQPGSLAAHTSERLRHQ
jgi:hypothetical protein